MRKLTTHANRLGQSHANRMRTATMAVVAAIVMVSIGACSSIDCPVQNTVSTQYAFATAAGERDTLADTLTVSTIRQNGTDSILLNKSVIDHLVEYRILHVGSVGTILLQNTVVLIGTKLVAEGKVGAKIIGELI